MALTDIAIDPVTNDIAFDGQRMSLVQGRRAVAQRILMRFNLFLGEWFLDMTAGFAYREYVLVKNPDLARLDVLFRAHILKTPEVIGLKEFELSFDGPNRTLSVSFVALTKEEEVPAALVWSPSGAGGFMLLVRDLPPIGEVTP